MRRLLAAVILLLTSAPAAASETDYLPQSSAWNGLSGLSEIARQLGRELVLLEELDWEQLPRGATLLAIYPLGQLAEQEILFFLQEGGRLLIADDFGQSRELLRTLGIQRLDGSGIEARRYFASNRNLPLAFDGATRHPLNSGVHQVVTNHPAYFLSALPTLLGFGRGRQQLLLAGRVGEGSLVALADPSVLINGMLSFADNRTLATNLLQQLAPALQSQIYMVTGHFRSRGQLRRPPTSSAAGSAQQFLTDYNGFLSQLNDLALTPRSLRAVVFVCGGLTVLGLVLLLPLPRRDLGDSWLHPGFGQNAAPAARAGLLGSARDSGSAHQTAQLLREDLEELLSEALHTPDPVFTTDPAWVKARAGQIGGPRAAELCARLLERVRRIPLGQRPGESSALHGFSYRDLAAIHADGLRLLQLLHVDTSPLLHQRKGHEPTI